MHNFSGLLARKSIRDILAALHHLQLDVEMFGMDSLHVGFKETQFGT